MYFCVLRGRTAVCGGVNEAVNVTLHHHWASQINLRVSPVESAFRGQRTQAWSSVNTPKTTPRAQGRWGTPCLSCHVNPQPEVCCHRRSSPSESQQLSRALSAEYEASLCQSITLQHLCHSSLTTHNVAGALHEARSRLRGVK